MILTFIELFLFLVYFAEKNSTTETSVIIVYHPVSIFSINKRDPSRQMTCQLNIFMPDYQRYPFTLYLVYIAIFIIIFILVARCTNTQVTVIKKHIVKNFKLKNIFCTDKNFKGTVVKRV